MGKRHHRTRPWSAHESRLQADPIFHMRQRHWEGLIAGLFTFCLKSRGYVYIFLGIMQGPRGCTEGPCCQVRPRRRTRKRRLRGKREWCRQHAGRSARPPGSRCEYRSLPNRKRKSNTRPEALPVAPRPPPRSRPRSSRPSRRSCPSSRGRSRPTWRESV